MMSLQCIPSLLAIPQYIRALREFIRYAKDNGAWIATDEQVARYYLSGMDSRNTGWIKLSGK